MSRSKRPRGKNRLKRWHRGWRESKDFDRNNPPESDAEPQEWGQPIPHHRKSNRFKKEGQ